MFAFFTAALTTAGIPTSPVSGWVPVVKMLSALLIVLGIMGLLTFLAKRYYPGAKGRKGPGADIHILGTVYMGSKRSIAVIGVGGRKLVVGMTPASMTLLTSFDEGDSHAPDEGSLDKGNTTPSFSKILKKQFLKRVGTRS